MCGTPSYLAPEVVKQDNGEGYDNVVDSWSVGVIVFSMYEIGFTWWNRIGANYQYTTGLQILVPSSTTKLKEIFAFELLSVALTGPLSSTQMRASVFQVRNHVEIC